MHAVTCHLMGAELSYRFFGQNKPFYLYIYIYIYIYMCICVCVFCGEYGFICMNDICVADISCDYSD